MIQEIITIEDKGFFDISPCDAGAQSGLPVEQYCQGVRDYYLFHFVLDGKGTYESPRGVYSVGKGQAFFIRPGEKTIYYADKNNPWAYVWVGFKGELAKEFLNAPDVFRYNEEIVNELNNIVITKQEVEPRLAGIGFKLYAELAKKSEHVNHSSKAKNYINTHYMENVSIQEISQLVGLNRKYLSRIFKETYGVTMQEYLIDRRLTEANKLLKAGYSVEETAYMVGYNDPFGFSKAYKKRFGNSPSNEK